jgi:hypothetical protein
VTLPNSSPHRIAAAGKPNRNLPGTIDGTLEFISERTPAEASIMQAITVSTTLVALTLIAGAAIAQQQQVTGTGAFCIKGATGPAKCEYQTMAQCDQARPQGSADQCVTRSQAAGTVGGPTLREQPNPPGGQKD